VSSYKVTSECLNDVITRGRTGDETCRPIDKVRSLRTSVHDKSVVIRNRVQARARTEAGGRYGMKREADVVSDIVSVSALPTSDRRVDKVQIREPALIAKQVAVVTVDSNGRPKQKLRARYDKTEGGGQTVSVRIGRKIIINSWQWHAIMQGLLS